MRITLKILSVLLGSLFLVEIYFQVNYRAASVLPSFVRIYDSRYFDEFGTPRFSPNTDAWHRSYGGRPDVKIHINGAGFRGAEPVQKPSVRVALLGDSTLFNGGVEQEETFPFLVEKAIREKFDDQSIELLNFGVGDTNARQYALKFQHHVLQFSPNLLIVFIYLNDAVEPLSGLIKTSSGESGIPWYHSFAFEHISAAISNFEILLAARNSDRLIWTADFLANAYVQNEQAWIRMRNQAEHDWGGGWKPESWAIIKSHLESMLSLAKQNGIEMWMVLMPAKPQVEIPETFDEAFLPQEYARQLSDTLKVRFLDPLPTLRSVANSADLYYDQCHFSVRGNEVMAEYLNPIIQEWVGARRLPK